LRELGDPCGANARGNQYSRQDGHEMMAECRPAEAPESALPSADDHAAGRAGEAVELTISLSASRNAYSQPVAGVPIAPRQGPLGAQKRPLAGDVAIAASADVLRTATRRP
jgi:hypothetical protein